MSKGAETIYSKRNFYVDENDIKKLKLKNPFYDSTSRNILDNILQFETLVYQPGNPIKPFQEKKYFLDDMIKTQDLLYTLDCIEALKYAKHIVSARKLLRKYLYSHYDIISCDLIKSEQKLSHIKKFNFKRKIKKELFYFTLDNTLSPAKSVRQYLHTYLSEQMDLSEYSKKNCRMFSFCSDSRDPSKNCDHNCFSCELKRFFYMPIYEIPLFLLWFTYADGRNFTNSNFGTNLPRHSASKSFSILSYQTTANKFMDLFYSDNKSALRPVDISRLFCCDNALLFRKLNKFNDYYNLYLSDSVLNRIIHIYKLTYNEILGLKKYIELNIFNDDFFIVSGLRSDFLDFMLPFNIYFQHIINYRNINYSEKSTISFDTLKSDILKLKILSIIIFKITLPMQKYNETILSILSGDNINLSSIENDIYETLKKNEFYNNYYGLKEHVPGIIMNKENNEFIPNFLNFNIIKNALMDIKYD